MSTRISEYTSPGEVPLSSDENLTSTLWEHEAAHPNHAILSYRVGDRFVPVTYAEMASQVRRLAAGIMGLGLEPGSRICIFSPTRYEFTVIDYAIWAAACATVTIYETSSADQVQWIVSDSGADVVICADDTLRAVFDEATASMENRPRVFTIDSGGLDELIEKGAQISDDQVMERAASAKHDDLATLVYTSGTTGLPKGCELTVRNFVWTVRQAMHVLRDVINMDAVTLMFLPLAHLSLIHI